MSNENKVYSIPSGDNFLKDKNISDRMYLWILNTSVKIGGDLFIPKIIRNGYKELNMNYRTFKKRFNRFVEKEFLIEYEKAYLISNKSSAYHRIVPKKILQTLYDTGIENITKVYIYLSSLYTTYRTNSYFTYKSIAETIGVETGSRNRYRIYDKIEVILQKLSELGLITYIETSGESKYNIRYKVTKVIKE